MTKDQREIQRKLRILQHAEETGHAARTSRYFGVGRSSFYRWRQAYAERGEAGIIVAARAWFSINRAPHRGFGFADPSNVLLVRPLTCKEGQRPREIPGAMWFQPIFEKLAFGEGDILFKLVARFICEIEFVFGFCLNYIRSNYYRV